MAHKTDEKDKTDVNIILKVQGRKFVVPKNILTEKSEYFKAKFSGSYKDSQETYLEYPDVPADSFRKVYDCLLGKSISFEDIRFPGIENALKISEFFCVDVFKNELRTTLVKSWDKTPDPLKSITFAEEVFSDLRPVLERRCIEVAHDIMQNVIQFQPCLAYQLVLHAVSKDNFLNSGILNDSYRFSECCVNTIRLMFVWLMNNSFAPSKLLHLIKYLRLEMFPPHYPMEVLGNLKPKDSKEMKSQKQLEEVLTVSLEKIKETSASHFECAYILSSSYNYSKFCTADVADFNSFCPKTWSWQTHKIQMAAGSRVIHVHIIDKTAFLITSESLDVIDLHTMKMKDSIKDEILAHFLNEIWVHQIQVLTCHDNGFIYMIPEEPDNEFRASLCPLLKFNINSKLFSTLPQYPESDSIIRAIFSHQGSVYFASLTTSLIIYKYDHVINSYTSLYNLDQSQSLANLNCQTVSVCFGIWQDIIYVFCFSSSNSFYLTLNPEEETLKYPEIMSLQDEHFTKGWSFTKPYLCHISSGFLIALQIHDCMPDPYTWNDLVLATFTPGTKLFQLLGLLPRPNNDTGGRFGFGLQPHAISP